MSTRKLKFDINFRIPLEEVPIFIRDYNKSEKKGVKYKGGYIKCDLKLLDTFCSIDYIDYPKTCNAVKVYQFCQVYVKFLTVIDGQLRKGKGINVFKEIIKKEEYEKMPVKIESLDRKEKEEVTDIYPDPDNRLLNVKPDLPHLLLTDLLSTKLVAYCFDAKSLQNLHANETMEPGKQYEIYFFGIEHDESLAQQIATNSANTSLKKKIKNLENTMRGNKKKYSKVTRDLEEERKKKKEYIRKVKSLEKDIIALKSEKQKKFQSMRHIKGNKY